ncbi:MAG: nucleotidyltransferase family protein, partial [Pseudomonadota bacterium]
TDVFVSSHPVDKTFRSLAQIADPNGWDCVEKTSSLFASVSSEILRQAEFHSVEPIVLRNLQTDSGEMLSAHASRWVADQRDPQFWANVQSMSLAARGDVIAQAFDDEGVDHVIVKGPIFAKHLYPYEADRPFTDVDFLVGEKDLERVPDIMRALGYSGSTGIDNKFDLLEQKWVVEDDRSVLIEVHGNLVHYPRLRSRISYGYAEAQICRAEGAHEPVHWLMTAVAHASAGHKFHNLKLVLDVLQAVRSLRPEDGAHALKAAKRLRFELELRACLAVAFACFPHVDADALMESHLPGLSWRGAAFPMTAKAVFEAPQRTARAVALRNAFRLRQHIAWR